MEFSGTFTIGRKEVAAFTRRMQWGQKQLANLAITAIGLIGGNFLLRFFVPTPTLLPQVICSLLGGGVAYGLCYFSMRYSIAKACNSEYVSGRRWVYEQTLHMSALGVTCTTAEGKESHVDYDELLVEECAEAFYIFVAKDSAWIVPKEQLVQPAEDAAHIREIFTIMAEPKRLNLRRVKG